MTSPDTLTPGTMTTINIVVFIVFNVWNRMVGNKKTQQAADHVIANTPSPGQVTKVDDKVVQLQAEVEQLKASVSEMKDKQIVTIDIATAAKNFAYKAALDVHSFRKGEILVDEPVDHGSVEAKEIPPMPIGKVTLKP